jgi:nucleoside-triphosphatase THEP1
VTVSLNTGQQNAADAFMAFLFSAEKEFIISGPGGVGKTHLMSYLIDETMPRYHDTCRMMGIPPTFTDVQMTATTNKAAEVLAQATSRPTSTVHSFLNLKVADNYDTGESRVTKTLNWMVHENKILFIDECSMIDSPLYTLVQEGMHDSKIVYVGDHCQLAPVMEPISPIYKNPDIPFFVLTEQMRNAGQPALMNVCQQLRGTVETGQFQPIRIVPGVIDLLDDNQMQAAIAATFQNQTRDSRILAYSNNRVMMYNDHIRALRQLPAEYQTGELLVNNSTMQLKKGRLSVEEEITILSRDPDTELVVIDEDEPNAVLEIRRCTIQTSIGEVFQNIPVPVNKAHHKALMQYYGNKKRWPLYFQLKNNYPDFRQRDAATVHKSQGSTYDSVFIDLANISSCHQPHVVARMLNVAFSRARSRVFLYGQLASKYGGLII